MVLFIWRQSLKLHLTSVCKETQVMSALPRSSKVLDEISKSEVHK